MENAPRRVGGSLLLVANLAAASVTAAVCVLAFIRPTLFGSSAPPAADSRMLVLPLDTGMAWLVFVASLALLLANFAWLVRRSPAPAARNYVVSETPTGPVRVAREALESGLRVSGESLPEITRLRVVVDCAQPRRVLVRGYFHSAEGTSNLNASERLRAALRDRFVEMVRLGDGARVDFELEFQGFAGKLTRKGGDLRAALEPERPPFTGPQYPIDEDESQP